MIILGCNSFLLHDSHWLVIAFSLRWIPSFLNDYFFLRETTSESSDFVFFILYSNSSIYVYLGPGMDKQAIFEIIVDFAEIFEPKANSVWSRNTKSQSSRIHWISWQGPFKLACI